MIPWALVAALVLGVAGCSGHPATAAGTPPTATPAAADASGAQSLSAASPSATASAVLPDGRSPAFLTSIDPGKQTVTFDLIEFLTGDAAKKAWQKANPGSGEDGPEDDYFIVNDNPKLRTLPVSASVQILVVDLTGAGVQSKPITFAAAPAYFAAQKPNTSDHKLAYNPFWLTVQNGQIVKMEEQFLP
jgi:hypothetical protein